MCAESKLYRHIGRYGTHRCAVGSRLKPLVEPQDAQFATGSAWADTRSVLEGVLWILRTGAQWAELPGREVSTDTRDVPSADSSNGCAKGRCVEVLRDDGEDLLARGQLDLAETLHRRHLRGGEKGGRCSWSNTAAAEWTKIMAIAERHGFPVAAVDWKRFSHMKLRFVPAELSPSRSTSRRRRRSAMIAAIAPMARLIRWMSGCNSNTVSS